MYIHVAYSDNHVRSWYNRIGDFLLSVWDKGKELLYGNGSSDYVSQINPTPECARSMALSAMAIECE